MKTGSFGSEAGDMLQSFPALNARANASRSIEEGSRFVGRDDGNRLDDLRSNVASQFMHMLEEHDRARMKVLAPPPTQTR